MPFTSSPRGDQFRRLCAGLTIVPGETDDESGSRMARLQGQMTVNPFEGGVCSRVSLGPAQVGRHVSL